MGGGGVGWVCVCVCVLVGGWGWLSSAFNIILFLNFKCNGVYRISRLGRTAFFCLMAMAAVVNRYVPANGSFHGLKIHALAGHVQDARVELRWLVPHLYGEVASLKLHKDCKLRTESWRVAHQAIFENRDLEFQGYE